MGGPLQPWALLMHRGMTRLTGHMFIAPARLIFICGSNKGGFAAALGRGIAQGVGGIVGGVAGAVVGAAGHQNIAGMGGTDEQTLLGLVPQHEGSLVMEPQQIKQIKDTFWTHGIWFNGQTYALPNGLPKEMKPLLGQWCKQHNVKNAGLIKT